MIEVKVLKAMGFSLRRKNYTTEFMILRKRLQKEKTVESVKYFSTSICVQ